MKGTIVIIDGNSLINRAYYAMQRPMITAEGIYTQGIFGFLNMLNKVLAEQEPEYMAVCWDKKAPTFRHLEYKEYKAGRRKMPPELAMQIPLMKELLQAYDITNLELEGFEADDLIGTVARLAEEAGLRPLIITGDKDALQLASDLTKVMITRKGISEFDLYDREKMLERYGLTPQQFIDLKGLMGDQSDNLPGIPGVGEKTGIQLLQQFGSVSELLARTDEIKSEKLRQKVADNAQLAVMSRKLAEIDTHVPLDIDLAELKIGDPHQDELIDLLVKLEFNSFLKKMHLDPARRKSARETEKAAGETSVSVRESVRIAAPADLNRLEKLLAGATVVLLLDADDSHIRQPELNALTLFMPETGTLYRITGSAELFTAVGQLLQAKNLLFVGHDLVEALYMLRFYGLTDCRVGFDTAVAQYVLDPSRSWYALKALVLEYFHQDIEAPESGEGEQLDLLGLQEDHDQKLAEETCLFIVRLMQAQQEKIRQNGLEKVLNEAELPLVTVLAGMEYEGFRADREALAAYGVGLKEEIAALVEQIYASAGAEFNINSPAQLGEILFEKLGLPAGKKTKKGYSTSADILEKIRDKHPIVDQVLRYRTLSKLNSTYVEGLAPLIGADSRIRAHFQQTVTATGRISCTEPNLQNIPVRNDFGRLLRKVFIPRDADHVLVGADYSQIELRVLAHLSGDEALIEAFNTGADIHRATASRVFGIPYEEVTPLDRSRAKAVNFGVIYGMSGFGLSEELKISRKDAENYIEDYFRKHEAVRSYMRGQVEFCRQNGYTETILGRRRYIPEIASQTFMVRSLGERLAMNSPIQGSAADIIKLAMIRVYRELAERKLASKLILQVHDELIIDTLKEELETVSELLVRNMQEAMQLKVALISDLNTGATWYDLK